MHAPRALARLQSHQLLLGLSLISIALFASGCSRRSCAKASTGGGGTPTANVAPTVQITSPSTNVEGAPGDVITIRWIDDDPDDVASTSVRAYPIPTADGQPSEYMIASGVPEADGDEQSASWDTFGVPEGVYRIEARTTDGKLEATALGAGLITLVVDEGKGGGGGTGGGSAGGNGSDIAWSVDTFDDGSFAVVGFFTGFIGFSGSSETLTATGSTDGFVARYASDGSFLWARGTNTAKGASFREVAALSDGSTVVAGTFDQSPSGGQIVISAGEADAITLDAPASPGVNAGNMFLARYGVDGSLLWAKLLSSNYTIFPGGMSAARTSQESLGLETGTDGVVFVASAAGTVTLDAGTPQELVLNIPTNTYWLVIAHYERDGTRSWVKTGTGPQFNYGRDLDAFPDGSFVLTGRRGSALLLGAGETNEVTLNSGTGTFIARFHADGTLDWARTGQVVSGSGYPHMGSVAAMSDGTSALVMTFEPVSLTFAGETPVTVTTSSVSLILVRFEADGDAFSGNVLPGAMWNDYQGNALDAFPDGALLMTGWVDGTEVFGAGEPNETSITANGNTFFAARYEADGTLGWVRTATGSSHRVGLGAATFADGTSVVCGYFYGTMTLDVGDGALDFATVGGQDAFVAKMAAALPIQK